MRKLLSVSAPLWLASVIACRQVAELPDPASPAASASAAKPAEDTRQPAWLTSEAAVFEHIQKTYEDAGFPEVRTAVLAVSEDAPLPSYQKQNRTLVIPPFLDGPDKMRVRLARVSANHFMGALGFVDAFGSAAAAYRAFQALVTVAIAHEMAHHLQAMRKSSASLGPDSIYDLEAEAIELEQAYLSHEIEVKAVPERWRDDYRRSIFAIRDAIPVYVMDSLPSDPKALRSTFMQAYVTYARGISTAEAGVNTQVSAATLVYAGYTERRIALLARGARSLSQLAADEKSKAK